jgi:hypothetical protein
VRRRHTQVERLASEIAALIDYNNPYYVLRNRVMEMSFKPKTITEKRPTPAEIARAVQQDDRLLRTTPAEVSVPPPVVVRRAPPVVTLTFKATIPFAKALTDAAEKEGGLRRLVARLTKQGGLDVPDADLSPPQTKRRTFDTQ